MAFSKRVLDKIERGCKGDQAMLDYMRGIIAYEFSGSKQYKKEYERLLRVCSKGGER